MYVLPVYIGSDEVILVANENKILCGSTKIKNSDHSVVLDARRGLVKVSIVIPGGKSFVGDAILGWDADVQKIIDKAWVLAISQAENETEQE